MVDTFAPTSEPQCGNFLVKVDGLDELFHWSMIRKVSLV
jgi:hypothetical protein